MEEAIYKLPTDAAEEIRRYICVVLKRADRAKPMSQGQNIKHDESIVVLSLAGRPPDSLCTCLDMVPRHLFMW